MISSGGFKTLPNLSFIAMGFKPIVKIYHKIVIFSNEYTLPVSQCVFKFP